MTDVHITDASPALRGATSTVVDTPGRDVSAPDAAPARRRQRRHPRHSRRRRRRRRPRCATAARPTSGAASSGAEPEDPAWVRPALLALLVGTGVLYLWGLGSSGWANSFYSAAVQAGTKSWKAFFFGSFDSSNFITVDKPPASLWVMELSARIFGLNSWSILVPQALEGVATVGVLYACVRRWFSPGAALLAGAVLALTPVATLMFRFNNPDALLTLLLTGAAYATIRALEAGRTRWLVLAGALVGFGFITKMLQAFILMPVLALVYLVAGPPKLGRRIVQLVWTGIALVVSGRLVGRGRRADAGLGPSLHRRLDRQQPLQSHLRLQRHRSPQRERDGQRRRQRGTAGSMWGPTGWDRLFPSRSAARSPGSSPAP